VFIYSLNLLGVIITNLPEYIQLLSSDPTNVYLIQSDGEAAVIDPYWVDPTMGVKELIKAAKPHRLTTSIITHAHFDHYGGCPALEDKIKVEILAHIADAWIIEDPDAFFKQVYAYENPTVEKRDIMLKLAGGRGVKVNRVLRDGDFIEIGHKVLQVIHTPGHSYGSICLMDSEDMLLFTGDTPFPSEWLPSWLGLLVDAQSYYNSLIKLSKIKPKMVLPGHGRIIAADEWVHEINAHIERFKTCEETILNILNEDSYAPLEKIRDRLIEDILNEINQDDVLFRTTEWQTVHSMMQKLCMDGKVEQGRGLAWRSL
jgi:glyoxylase-like metal-dependent hydrolase (beta-lactamase superfamily II)